MKKFLLLLVTVILLTGCGKKSQSEDVLITDAPSQEQSTEVVDDYDHVDYRIYTETVNDKVYRGYSFIDFIEDVIPAGSEYIIHVKQLEGDTIYSLEAEDGNVYTFTLESDGGFLSLGSFVETFGNNRIDGITDDVVSSFILWENLYFIPEEVNTDWIYLTDDKRIGFKGVDIKFNPNYTIADNLVGVKLNDIIPMLDRTGCKFFELYDTYIDEVADGIVSSYVDATYFIIYRDKYKIFVTCAVDSNGELVVDSAICTIGVEDEPVVRDGELYLVDESKIVSYPVFSMDYRNYLQSSDIQVDEKRDYKKVSLPHSKFIAEELEENIDTPTPSVEGEYNVVVDAENMEKGDSTGIQHYVGEEVNTVIEKGYEFAGYIVSGNSVIVVVYNAVDDYYMSLLLDYEAFIRYVECPTSVDFTSQIGDIEIIGVSYTDW